ncbi:hypothetical protein B0H19DRAFT_1256950 [Mycena capillaripes]|nr:hypothetical protein B0H19DRAFT_1256950 [Mycena capillaripes]
MGLAHQVDLLCGERARFTTLHNSRLIKLSEEAGFTGSLTPGVSTSPERHVHVQRDTTMRISPNVRPQPADDEMEGEGEGEGDEEGEDDEDGNLTEAFEHIVCITHDESAAAGNLVHYIFFPNLRLFLRPEWTRWAGGAGPLTAVGKTALSDIVASLMAATEVLMAGREAPPIASDN